MLQKQSIHAISTEKKDLLLLSNQAASGAFKQITTTIIVLLVTSARHVLRDYVTSTCICE